MQAVNRKLTTNKPQNKNQKTMNIHNYPLIMGVQLTKAEFSLCTGVTPNRLRLAISANEDKLKRLGYGHYDKMLMPQVSAWLCEYLGVSIDMTVLQQKIVDKRREVRV